jgi:hypothetical protein
MIFNNQLDPLGTDMSVNIPRVSIWGEQYVKLEDVLKLVQVVTAVNPDRECEKCKGVGYTVQYFDSGPQDQQCACTEPYQITLRAFS